MSHLPDEDLLRENTTRKKPVFPVSEGLRYYLSKHGREVVLPVTYERLLEFSMSVPLRDEEGNDTLWETVAFAQPEMAEISAALTRIYVILKTHGDWSVMDHLYMDRIDYCTFGNSKPFRIRIVNAHNDNQDYYYIKKADASRVYGLELEHLLSPNRMHYLTFGNTLVEEHVVGIPGDLFIRDWLELPHINKVRLAKELVKFNERCFIRLLGDMRAYNFVVDLTPDFEDFQIRIRPMDFDQQSFPGHLRAYRPQFYISNNPLVFFCLDQLTQQTAYQYQREEYSLMVRRMGLIQGRLRNLLAEMSDDVLSLSENTESLRQELAEFHKRKQFLRADSMGDLLRESLQMVIDRTLAGSPEAAGIELNIE